MKKAQESLLLEHVVPLRMIFPGPSTGGNEQPFGSYNLQNWKKKIDSELQLWKRDHNYIPILPMNVGFQQVGGTAKALILHQEFRLFLKLSGSPTCSQLLVLYSNPITYPCSSPHSLA